LFNNIIIHVVINFLKLQSFIFIFFFFFLFLTWYYTQIPWVIANGNTNMANSVLKLLSLLTVSLFLVPFSKIVKNLTFLTDFIIICHSFLQMKTQILLNLIFLNMANLESKILPILYYKFNVLMMWYFYPFFLAYSPLFNLLSL
jgi:hypothetical protein